MSDQNVKRYEVKIDGDMEITDNGDWVLASEYDRDIGRYKKALQYATQDLDSEDYAVIHAILTGEYGGLDE